jgi:hypothetical protein
VTAADDVLSLDEWLSIASAIGRAERQMRSLTKVGDVRAEDLSLLDDAWNHLWRMRREGRI